MTDIAPPIVRTVTARDVPHGGTHVVIEADADQRAALAVAAAASEVASVEALRAELLVKPWSGHGFSVTGRLTARLTQTCVVSLEPISATLDETIDVKLVPPEEMAKYEVKPDENGEIVLDASALDAPEPFEDGVIDVGSIVSEFFILAVDPYPRKPGAVFDPDAAGVGDRPEERSPFAALARLKKE